MFQKEYEKQKQADMDQIYSLHHQNRLIQEQNGLQLKESKELLKVKKLNREQSKALSELRQILDSTLKVKIKYEKIIGKLVSTESLKESTIGVIREV